VSFTTAGPATISGSILTITGAGQVTVTANQAGDTTYAAATPVSQSFTVAQAASTLTWATPAPIAYGTPLSASQLNATASVPGTFTYSPASGTLSAGAHTLSVTFTPADTANYTSTAASVVLQVNRATPTITWATPATITYGTPLSASQLNATASVPGTFTYSPATGITVGAGAQTLSVAFTPTDTANYTTANASVLERVNPAVLTVTADSLSAPFGTTLTLGATITGFVNGDNLSVVSGTPALATTANALSLPGVYPISAGVGSLSAANYIFSLVGGIYTVTFTGPAPSAGTQCNGAYSGNFTGNITPSQTVTAGNNATYTINLQALEGGAAM